MRHCHALPSSRRRAGVDVVWADGRRGSVDDDDGLLVQRLCAAYWHIYKYKYTYTFLYVDLKGKLSKTHVI